MDNMSLSDIATVTRDNDGGWGGNSAWVLIILFALIFGWGGNGFGNRGNGVTEADICNANSFNELKGSVGRLSDQVNGMYTGLQNGMAQLGYQDLQNFNMVQRDLCQGFAAVNAGINQARFDSQECCCATQRAIDGVNYNGAMNTAAINANTTAGIQKILDKMCENETNALRSRVQQLELQSAMCGVVRYPTQTTYASHCNPFFGNWGGCGCNGNI